MRILIVAGSSNKESQTAVVRIVCGGQQLCRFTLWSTIVLTLVAVDKILFVADSSRTDVACGGQD